MSNLDNNTDSFNQNSSPGSNQITQQYPYQFNIAEVIAISKNLLNENYIAIFTILFLFHFPAIIVGVFFPFPELKVGEDPITWFQNIPGKNIAIFFFFSLISKISIPAIQRFVYNAIYAKTNNYKQAIAEAMQNYFFYFLSVILFAIILSVGILMLVLPAIFAFFALYFAMHLSGIYRFNPSDAISYCWKLVKVTKSQTLNIILFSNLISFTMILIGALIISLFKSEATNIIIQTSILPILGFCTIFESVYIMNLNDMYMDAMGIYKNGASPNNPEGIAVQTSDNADNQINQS